MYMSVCLHPHVGTRTHARAQAHPERNIRAGHLVLKFTRLALGAAPKKITSSTLQCPRWREKQVRLRQGNRSRSHLSRPALGNYACLEPASAKGWEAGVDSVSVFARRELPIWAAEGRQQGKSPTLICSGHRRSPDTAGCLGQEGVPRVGQTGWARAASPTAHASSTVTPSLEGETTTEKQPTSRPATTLIFTWAKIHPTSRSTPGSPGGVFWIHHRAGQGPSEHVASLFLSSPCSMHSTRHRAPLSTVICLWPSASRSRAS